MISFKKEKISKKLPEILLNSTYFRLVFLMDLFFFSVDFFDTIARVINVLLLVWGAIILFNNYIFKNTYRKILYYKIILIFLASCFLTIFLHSKDNLLMNLIYMFTYFLCFFVFYGMYAEKDKTSIEKEMFLFFKIFVVISTVISTVSLIITCIKIQFTVFDYYWIGIYENRFIGIYTNSNLLGLFCVLSVIFAHITYMTKSNRRFTKIFLIYSAIINFVSLILSDSNGAFIFLLIYIIVILFYYLFKDTSEISIKIVFKNLTILLVSGFMLIVGSFSLRMFCQDQISILINEIHIKESVHDNKLSIDNKKTENLVDIGRTLGENNYDGTSGRKTLIKQSLIMFQRNPIMGVGIANIPKYGERYIVGGLRFSNLHNGYLTILVAWGIVGLLIFILYSSLIALKCTKILFKINEKQNTAFPYLFCAIVGYCVYSLVEITILSEITFTIFIFWAILGYSFSYITDYKYGDDDIFMS